MRKEGTVAIQSVGLRGRRAGGGTIEASHHEKREGVPCCWVSGRKRETGCKEKIEKTRKVNEIG